MTDYIAERKNRYMFGLLLLGWINLYFGFLCATHVWKADLFYFDGLYLGIWFLLAGWDFARWHRIQKGCTGEQTEMDRDIQQWIGKTAADLWETQRLSYEKLIHEQKEEILELTDYMTKWAHEAKLPLAALLLMNERNQDFLLQKDMQDCLQRLQQQLNTVMMSSKLKNLENDVEIEQVSLEEMIKESLKNQSYFLIRENVQIEREVKGIEVYSDRRWLVYLLDQLLSNTVKYHKENPILHFYAEKMSDGKTIFSISDNGVGVRREEIPYLFDRGFIGTNLRDGDYRSTGMGLYFVKKMAERLGIGIEIRSDLGKGMEVRLCFSDNAEFFCR